MEQIHNIYISSTKKNGNDTNYNYNIYLSNYNIHIKPEQEAYLNITGFQSLNTFYNINSKSNTFIVKLFNTLQGVGFTYTITIEDGNYDIQNFMDTINVLCLDYFTMSYDYKKNIYKYLSNVDYTKVITIKPSSYNSKYFGLPADVFTMIPNDNTLLSSSIINMNNWSLIIIKVIGLIEQTKTLDNFNNELNRGDIAAIISRQDSPINSLINWNDINNSFQKKINNGEINYLNFQFYNEYNEVLTDINDWLLLFKIVIKNKI
jgi:hypothetical protein